MKQEFFIEKGNLINEQSWKDKIQRLKTDDGELDDPESKIIGTLRKNVDEAIKERIEGLDHFAICFSGGLDSSYIAAIAKKKKADFTCYTVGFQDGDFRDPEDVYHAQDVAKFLKLSDDEFRSRIFTFNEIEDIIKKTSRILAQAGANTVVNAGVGAVEVAAHSISKKEDVFFSGLGSEELFAGYERHKLNPSNDECFDGLMKMHQRDLIRDTAIPKALGFSFSTPFLDEELIRYSLKIPIRYKINHAGAKMILRKAAEPYLGKFSERPKKAAQYGSNTDKAIEKLAHKGKFATKKAYLESL